MAMPSISMVINRQNQANIRFKFGVEFEFLERRHRHPIWMCTREGNLEDVRECNSSVLDLQVIALESILPLARRMCFAIDLVCFRELSWNFAVNWTWQWLKRAAIFLRLSALS